MPSVFPADVFDEPAKLLAAIGSFWAGTYEGSFPVASILHARARLDAQTHLNLLELLASMSRYTVPVFHTENWYFLQLRESEKNQTVADMAKFDGTYKFEPGSLSWGVPLASTVHNWYAPDDLAGVRLAMNRITTPSLTMVHGLDFLVARDAATGRTTISFRENPFANELVPRREIVEDNVVVDREVGVWLYRGQFDIDNVYEQFGYVLGLRLRSSDGYRQIVNAVFDALVDGGTAKSVDGVFAAIAGVPFAREGGEVVEDVLLDARHLWVITDKNAYRLHRRATPVVAPGDVLEAGQPLDDTLTVYEFNRGLAPAGLPSLAVPRGHLAAGYRQDVVFENKTVPLVVEEGVGGYTKVSFEVGGDEDDVEKFWDDVHAAGVARGQTLAMLLDTRPEGSRDANPTALALPGIVNPLVFLIQNVFRNNLYVVEMKPATFGAGALGLHNATVLRKVIPPHTSVILVVRLAIADDPVILNGPGDAVSPGYEEDVGHYAGAAVSESLDPAGVVVERVRCRQIGGGCR